MRFQTQWLQRVVGVFTLTTTLFFIPATKSFAQASLFDPTFAFNSGADDLAYSVVLQNDGKILVGGDFTQGGGSGLLRLNSDGQIDQSFVRQTDGSVSRSLKQPDGKILVAGSFTILQGVARQRLGRLLTNGLVDLSFDPGALLGAGHTVFALGLQSDGKILVGTASQTSQGQRGGLVRLHPSGQIDSSFIQTNVFNGFHIFAIAPRTNGSILVGGGFQAVNSFTTPALALISTNGELNTNYVSTVKTNSQSGVYAIAEEPDGSLVVGGGFWRGDLTNRLVLAKLTPELNWDGNFQPDVFDPTPGIFHSGDANIMALTRQADGKLLVGGTFQEIGGYWRQCVARLTADGHVDPCFDPGMGLFPYQFVFGVTSIALQTDGKVLVAGYFFNPMSSSHHVTRLLPQSDCDAIRVHISPFGLVAGTCTPGGTNHLQWTTNLVDWQTAMSSTTPYVYSSLPYTLYDRMFFRVKKEY